MRKFLICRISDDKIAGCLWVYGKDSYKIEIDKAAITGEDRKGIPAEFKLAYDMFGRLEMSSEEVRCYLNHRVVPPDRHCIDYLLKGIGLTKYDPIEVMYRGYKGRNAQDECYWKEIEVGE